MPVHSNRAALEARLDDAIPKALTGAAQVYRNAMQESLRNPPEGGYTTGAWDHGMAGVAGSVAVGEPERQGAEWFVAVGTNVVYAKYWELGHHNLFMWDGGGQGPPFVRVERWRPTLNAQAVNIGNRFDRLLRAFMRASAPGSGG